MQFRGPRVDGPRPRKHIEDKSRWPWRRAVLFLPGLDSWTQTVEHSNSGKKFRFDSILATESIFFDSIRQSDKFDACTLIFK